MILELITNPITATGKLFNSIKKNHWIALSIALPLIIALLPTLIMMHAVNSVMKPLISLGSIFGSTFLSQLGVGGLDANGDIAKSVSSSLNSIIFKAIFGRTLLLVIIVMGLIFIGFFCINKLKKRNIGADYVWKAVIVSSIQILYYMIFAWILGFISLYFYFVIFIGVLNTLICSYSLIYENDELDSSVVNYVDYIENIEHLEKVEACKKEGSTDDSLQSSSFEQDKRLTDTYVSKNNEKSTDISEKVRNLTKKQKVLISVVAFLVVCIFGIYFAGTSLTSKEAVSKKLISAIKAEDAKEMAKYIVSSDPRLKIDEKTIQPYIKYMKENPSYSSSLINDISSQASEKDDIGQQKQSSRAAFISDGKKYLFFDNYVYKIPAYFINVRTQYKGTEVSLNNKVLYTADKEDMDKQCGPYLPGQYTITGKIKTDYAEATSKTDVIINPNTSGNIVDAMLELEGQKISLYSDYKDAKVFINGKDTGIAVKDIQNLIPLSLDKGYKIKLQYKFPWGTMESEEKEINNSYIKLSFDGNSKELVEAIKPTIVEFVKSWVDSNKALDSTKIAGATDEYKKSLQTDIEYKKSSNSKFDGAIQTVVIDSKEMELDNYKDDDKENFRVNVKVLPKGNFTENGNPYFSNTSYSLTLKYDEASKKFVVENFQSSWFSSPIENGTELEIK